MWWVELLLTIALVLGGFAMMGLIGLNVMVSYLRGKGRHEEADAIITKVAPYIRYFFVG